MWIYLTLGSALLLGLYDLAKKQALKTNDTLWILFASTALSALFLLPFISQGSFPDHLRLMFKAVLVSLSWISGLGALKHLPITTASTLKASRPVFVLLGSILIFGERLNLMQWAGVILVLASLFMLSRSSKAEGISFKGNRGFALMVVSILTGVASALYDKRIMASLEPQFVQSWTNIYISVILLGSILVKRMVDKDWKGKNLKLDWTLPVIAICITLADFMYFSALKCDGALLSVISLVRRSSVIVTFAFGAILFREKKIRSKALDLAVLLTGMIFLVLGS